MLDLTDWHPNPGGQAAGVGSVPARALWQGKARRPCAAAHCAQRVLPGTLRLIMSASSSGRVGLRQAESCGSIGGAAVALQMRPCFSLVLLYRVVQVNDDQLSAGVTGCRDPGGTGW
jgi:hypothetical protein